MPASLTYPGVYIEEIPSGVHTITGVATSIAAFIGWADQGPIYEATLVQSWSDFASQYGGLDPRSNLGYAVNQFFGNGGQQAYIIRVAWDGTLTASPGPAPTACATAAAPALPLGAVISATLGGVSGYTTLGVTAATLSSIAITPASPVLTTPGVNSVQAYTATGTYSDNTTQDLTADVTWSASPSGAVTFNGATATFVSGAAPITITATFASVSGTLPPITLAPAISLVSIAISPAAATIPVGLTQAFKAAGTYSDGSVQDVTATATWVPTPSPAGAVTMVGAVATAVAAGSATITAAVGVIVSGTAAALTTTSASLTGITVTSASANVPIGSTLQLAATGAFSSPTPAQNLTAVATWTSSVPAVATVAAGLVTGLTKGSTVITASWGGKTATATITATAALTLSSITVTPAVANVGLGYEQQFRAVGTYSDGVTTEDLTSTVTWSSGTPTAVSILSSGTTAGLATALAATGSMAISANSPGAWGNSLSVSVSLQASNPTRFSILVQQAPSQPGGPFQTLESFVNLSTNPSDASYVVTVINSDSQYIAITDPAPATFGGTPVASPPVAPGSTPPVFKYGADGSVLTPATDGNFEVVLSAGGPPGGSPAPKVQGLYLLERVDIFNLLCIPGETDAPTIQELQTYCVGKRAFYIVDCPQLSTTTGLINTGPVGSTPGPLTGASSANSAYYFPWVEAPDPLAGNRSRLFPPCGFVAGIYAATDASRGVWKAPAGIDASLSGLSGLQYNLTDLENGSLNTQAINCLREFRVYGDVVWGARTLQGNDQAGSEWKYVPIRRLALYLESSLYDGTQWVVFEPNDTPLWSQIRLNVGTFMQGLFLQGAFQGTTPQQAYFVKCDGENNPQSSIDQGVVNILVGFAPLYPAEFVVIQIQQLAGQTQS